MSLKDALCRILRYMIDEKAGSFTAECTLDNGIVAKVKISIVSLKEVKKMKGGE